MGRKEENGNHIRKGEVISLRKRPGERLQSGNTDDAYTVRLTEMRETLKCLSTAMCLLMRDLIILPIHAILEKESLTYCYT